MPKKISRQKYLAKTGSWLGWTCGITLIFVYAALIVSATQSRSVMLSWWELALIPSAGAICTLLFDSEES
jgi:FtsH-binding integral membrane protein